MTPSDAAFAAMIARRVGLAGFPPEEEDRLGRLFTQAGAICQTFHAGALPLAVRRCDVALIMVDEFRPTRVEVFTKPVIACVTPDSIRNYPQWIRESATDWFFAPGAPEELLTRVTVAIQRHARGQRLKAGRPFCVLLADDDLVCHGLLRFLTQSSGIVFRAVDDGRKALEVVRDWQPDLLVLDVNMPVMDGFEVLEMLKRDEVTKSTPVIMLTASNQDSEILRGLRLGAKDYVVKPFNTTALLERIRQVRSHKFA